MCNRRRPVSSRLVLVLVISSCPRFFGPPTNHSRIKIIERLSLTTRRLLEHLPSSPHRAPDVPTPPLLLAGIRTSLDPRLSTVATLSTIVPSTTTLPTSRAPSGRLPTRPPFATRDRRARFILGRSLDADRHLSPHRNTKIRGVRAKSGQTPVGFLASDVPSGQVPGRAPVRRAGNHAMPAHSPCPPSPLESRRDACVWSLSAIASPPKELGGKSVI